MSSRATRPGAESLVQNLWYWVYGVLGLRGTGSTGYWVYGYRVYGYRVYGYWVYSCEVDGRVSVLLGRVTDAVEMGGRLVVVTDTAHEDLPREPGFRVGDRLELRAPDGTVFETSLAGIEVGDPWTPRDLFTFRVPGDVKKSDVPCGAEVWAFARTRA